MANFYPRPPRGGRLSASTAARCLPEFLSTPSARRATLLCGLLLALGTISIHALREEGDEPADDRGRRGQNFYPRPPRGGRRAALRYFTKPTLFLSTPSARRATRQHGRRSSWREISIHALREEGDFTDTQQPANTTTFLSTPSARRATCAWISYGRPWPISIHALREEGDSHSSQWASTLSNFYPRPPRGGRQQKQRQNLYFLINYTTFCTNLEEP